MNQPSSANVPQLPTSNPPPTKEKVQTKTLSERLPGLNNKTAVALILPSLAVAAAGNPAALGLLAGGFGIARAGPSAFWQIINLADRETKTGLGGLFNKVIKWGESGMTKEMKTALQIYEGGVQSLTALPAAGAAVLGVGVTLIGLLSQKAKTDAKNQEKRLSDIADRVKKEMAASNEAMEFLKNPQEAEALTESQKTLIKKLITLDKADPNIKDLETALTENIYSILHTNIEGDNEKTKALINMNSEFDNSVLGTLLDEGLENLDKALIYLGGGESGLPDNLVTKLSAFLGDDVLKRAFLEKELLRIKKVLSEGKTIEEIKAQRRRASLLATKLNGNAEMQRAYREAYLAGAAYDLTRLDEKLARPPHIPLEATAKFKDLGFEAKDLWGTGSEYKEDGYNPLIYLGFATTPTKDEVEKEKIRIEEAVKRVGTLDIRAIKVGTNLLSTASNKRERLQTLSRMSLEDIDKLSSISKLSKQVGEATTTIRLPLDNPIDITDTGFIAELKTIFDRQKGEDQTASLYGDLLDLELRMLDDPNLYPIDKREAVIVYLKSIQDFAYKYLNSDDYLFGDGTKEGYGGSLINFAGELSSKSGSEDVLKDLHEALAGDMEQLLEDDIDTIKTNINQRMGNKLTIIQKLEEKISNSQAITDAHITHLAKLVKADVAVESNIDSLGYIEILKQAPSSIGEPLKGMLSSLEIPQIPDLPIKSTDLVEGGKLYNFKMQLSQIGSLLIERMDSINYSIINETDLSDELQQEIRVLLNLLNILNVLGLEKVQGLPQYKLNDKMFQIYLNGLAFNVSRAGVNNIEDALVANNDPGLKLGTANKVTDTFKKEVDKVQDPKKIKEQREAVGLPIQTQPALTSGIPTVTTPIAGVTTP